ncbi:hypothetical protein [Devosia sp. A369]
MDMIERSIGATVRSSGNQAAKLTGEIFGGKMARLDKPDALACFL